MIRRCLMIASLATLAACAKKKQEPETLPAPVAEAVRAADQRSAEIEAQTGTPVDVMTIRFVEPPDDVFVGLMIAAAGWAKTSASARTIGVYQAQGASDKFRIGIGAVTNKYAFRPINPSDYGVVCGGNAPSQTSITSRTAKCSMRYVDAVLAFHSIRMMRDSGYVGTSITRVPSGANRSERTYYCITLGRAGADWKARRSERDVEPSRCPRNVP